MDFKDKLVVITGGAQGIVSKAECCFEILMLRPSAQGYGSKYNPNGVEILKHTTGSPWVDEGATVTFAT